MFNLGFIEDIENGMPRLIEEKNKFNETAKCIEEKRIDIKNRAIKLKEMESELTEKEFEKLSSEIENEIRVCQNLAKTLADHKKHFENVRMYMLTHLQINKSIIYEYKENDKNEEIEKHKYLTQNFENTQREKLDNRLTKLARKLKLNDLTKDEIEQLDESKRVEAIEAREQYLNNKREYEKYKKMKYAAIVGDRNPDEVIEQYKKAIELVANEFKVDNIENVISKVEDILEVEKQEVQIKFDLKTHTYTYINERGKEIKYEDFYKKDKKNNKYKSVMNETNKKSTIEFAKNKGLTNAQLKKIDYNVVNILQINNPKLLDNYMETIKKSETPNFSLVYNLKDNKIDKNEKIARREFRQLKKVAKKQEKINVATVIRNKAKGKIAAIIAAIGLGGTVASITASTIPTLPNAQEKSVESYDDQIKEVKPKVENSENSKIRNSNNKMKDYVTKSVDYEKNKVQVQNIDKTVDVGDNVTISLGTNLYKDPVDSIRVQNGEETKEKVQVKNSLENQVYKVDREGYYSIDGRYVSIKEGEDLEEALKQKGLDKSFINDENTVKMYLTTAPGISQWVCEKDVVKVDERDIENNYEEER